MKLKNGLKLNNENAVNIYLRFADESMLCHFDFNTISEKHISTNFNYLIEEITLGNLMKAQKLVGSEDIFIAEF